MVAWRGLEANVRGRDKTMDFGFGLDSGATGLAAFAESDFCGLLIVFFAFAGFALGFCLFFDFVAMYISIPYAILLAIYC